jgi:hypothetical protein
MLAILAVATLSAWAIGPRVAAGDDGPGGGLKTETFDRDPGWDGHNNHVVPKAVVTVKQDFGYSDTNFAGRERGEFGGQVWRTSTPASYAAEIPARTLDDKLSASGVFTITATSGSSSAFFGWFNAARQADGGRQSTLGFRLAGEASGARLTLQLVTGTNQACGTKVTPWVVDKDKPKGPQRKFRPTSIKNDGTRYAWTMEYDPRGNDGGGRITFTIRGDHVEPEAFEGQVFTVDLPDGYKGHGTVFDRFGLTNSMRAGNSMTIYFDDLHFDGRSEDFAKDAGWIGSGNRVTFEEREHGGAHAFGFSEATQFAGGAAAGEVGGVLWRSGDYGYYADRVGPLTLDDRLEASGTVVLKTGAPDSGMFFGWFNSADKAAAPADTGNFLGVKIGGPTRVGHYFAPSYATAAGTKLNRATGPVLVPSRMYRWKIVYDPAANDAKGAIEVTLGDESTTVNLKDGDKARGATLDRFGLFTAGHGGSFVRAYFDDLTYTATPLAR